MPTPNPQTENTPEAGVDPTLVAAISKTISEALAPIKEAMSTKATGHATGLPGTSEGDPDRPHISVGGEVADKEKGLQLARFVKAVAVGKMLHKSPAAVAKEWGYTRVAKALEAQSLTAGGAMVPDVLLVEEFIELLRNTTVVRKAGPRTLNMAGSGTIRIPRQTGAATAYYVNENAAVTPSEQTTDQAAFSEKKLMALTPVSNDLLRMVSASAERFVRDDLLQVMGIREDLAFLRGTGSENEPRGFRYRIHSDHIYAETVATEGAPSLQETRNELSKARKKLQQANIFSKPMTAPVWFMAPNAENHLLKLQDSNGNLVYAPEMEQRKTLKGYPFFVTNQIPENLGGDGDESELYLVDMQEVVIVDFMSLEIDFFPNGTWNNSGTLVSGISNDQSVIRVISKHDINLRHTKGGVVVTELSWDYA